MKKTTKIILAVLLLLILASAASAGYFYKKYDDIKKNPNKVAEDQIAALMKEMSQFTELPKDETPTLATVTDKDKLKDQDFFKNAENGDKILIYTASRKVILYRPSQKRIIDFTPLMIGDTSQSSQPNSKPEETK
jgi:hypothetical protein